MHPHAWRREYSLEHKNATPRTPTLRSRVPSSYTHYLRCISHSQPPSLSNGNGVLFSNTPSYSLLRISLLTGPKCLTSLSSFISRFCSVPATVALLQGKTLIIPFVHCGGGPGRLLSYILKNSLPVPASRLLHRLKFVEEEMSSSSELQICQPDVARASTWPGAGSHWNWWLWTMLQIRESWSVRTPPLRVRTGAPVQVGTPDGVEGEASCLCEGED